MTYPNYYLPPTGSGCNGANPNRGAIVTPLDGSAPQPGNRTVREFGRQNFRTHPLPAGASVSRLGVPETPYPAGITERRGLIRIRIRCVVRVGGRAGKAGEAAGAEPERGGGAVGVGGRAGECLGHFVVLGKSRLRYIVSPYVAHHNLQCLLQELGSFPAERRVAARRARRYATVGGAVPGAHRLAVEALQPGGLTGRRGFAWPLSPWSSGLKHTHSF
jgi:hypothetical protein